MRYKPMLAYPVSSKPIDYSKPTFIQPKLDGVRCVIQYDKEYGVKAYSRTGKPWLNIDHILMELYDFFQKHPDIVLDGELYNHDLRDNFEKIISLVRKTKPTLEDRLDAEELTQFHCYDIIDEAMEFSKRIDFLNNAFSNICPSIYIVKTTHGICSGDQAKAIHQMNLDTGYEGSIVRTNDVYKCGRSWSLRKFKDFSDAEALIVGYEEGKGKRVGTLGKFVMQDEDGNQFGCPPGKGYNYKDLTDILNNVHDYIGQVATFTYFERTKAGSYRHPHYKAIRNYE